jgi:hypothetical protein
MRRLACLHHKAARAIGILHFDSSRYFIQISLTDPDSPSMGPYKPAFSIFAQRQARVSASARPWQANLSTYLAGLR